MINEKIENMKKYQKILIIAVCVVLVISGITIFFEKDPENPNLVTNTNDALKKPLEEWNTFGDYVNGWEMKYPPNVKAIALVSDHGSTENILNNMIFSTEFGKPNYWAFGIAVTKNEYRDIESIVKDYEKTGLRLKTYTTVAGTRAAVFTDPDRPANTYITFVKNHKLFNTDTSDADGYEKILSGFKFYY